MSKPSEWMTVPEASEYARCKPRTIYSWLHQGLASYKTNGRRIDPDDLDEFLKRRKQNILI